MRTDTPSFTQLPLMDSGPDAANTPLWRGRRGQIANLWLYVYCLLLGWLILPVCYALYRALATYYHHYELVPSGVRITTGLYRPHVHTHEVRFDRFEAVSVSGPQLYRIVNRGNVIIERSGNLPPVYLEAIHDPSAVKDRIEAAWRQAQASE
jgi:hypothetical protein